MANTIKQLIESGAKMVAEDFTEHRRKAQKLEKDADNFPSGTFPHHSVMAKAHEGYASHHSELAARIGEAHPKHPYHVEMSAIHHALANKHSRHAEESLEEKTSFNPAKADRAERKANDNYKKSYMASRSDDDAKAARHKRLSAKWDTAAELRRMAEDSALKSGANSIKAARADKKAAELSSKANAARRAGMEKNQERYRRLAHRWDTSAELRRLPEGLTDVALVKEFIAMCEQSDFFSCFVEVLKEEWDGDQAYKPQSKESNPPAKYAGFQQAKEQSGKQGLSAPDKLKVQIQNLHDKFNMGRISRAELANSLHELMLAYPTIRHTIYRANDVFNQVMFKGQLPTVESKSIDDVLGEDWGRWVTKDGKKRYKSYHTQETARYLHDSDA